METLLESLLGNKIFEDEFDDVFQPMPMEEFVKNLTSQKGWSQNKDGSWDVEGDVSLSAMGLTKLPIRFGKIFRTFSCSHNSLTTLEGSPRRVGGGFYCNNNQLTTLEGGPEWIGGQVWADNNQLTNLVGGPEYVKGNYWVTHNNLVSLKGAPKKVGGKWELEGNPASTDELLKTLEK